MHMIQLKQIRHDTDYTDRNKVQITQIWQNTDRTFYSFYRKDNTDDIDRTRYRLYRMDIIQIGQNTGYTDENRYRLYR